MALPLADAREPLAGFAPHPVLFAFRRDHFVMMFLHLLTSFIAVIAFLKAPT